MTRKEILTEVNYLSSRVDGANFARYTDVVKAKAELLKAAALLDVAEAIRGLRDAIENTGR